MTTIKQMTTLDARLPWTRSLDQCINRLANTNSRSADVVEFVAQSFGVSVTELDAEIRRRSPRVVHECDCHCAHGCNVGVRNLGCYYVTSDLDYKISFAHILEQEGYGTEKKTVACDELLDIYHHADWHQLDQELMKWYSKWRMR